MFKRLKVIFTGTVQGVGFRVSVQRLAQDFLVTGYVRNVPSGAVELVAEGEGAELKNFIRAIETSYLSSYICKVSTEWNNARREFSGFRITG